MTGILSALLLILAAPAAQAQREPDGRPVVIADPRVLVGNYHFEERDGKDLFAVDVSLNADGTAVYAVAMGGGEGGIRAVGFWTVSDDIIHIHNRPGPVRLEQVGAPTTDPRVALSVVVALSDGSPAEGLGVSWPNANALYMLGDGRHEVRREEGPVLGAVTIDRAADGKELARFVMTPNAPNSYRFVYHPSDVEPFDISAMALDPRAQVLEVELGSASAKLHRVGR